MTRVRVVPSTGPASDTVCFRCRQKGHYKVDCLSERVKQPAVRSKLTVSWADVASRPKPAEPLVPARSLGYTALQRRVQELESQICALREQLSLRLQNSPVVVAAGQNGAAGAASALSPAAADVSRQSSVAAPAGQKRRFSRRKKQRLRKQPEPLQDPAAAVPETTKATASVVAVQQQQEQKKKQPSPPWVSAADVDGDPSVAWLRKHDDLKDMLDAAPMQLAYWVKDNKQEVRAWLRDIWCLRSPCGCRNGWCQVRGLAHPALQNSEAGFF